MKICVKDGCDKASHAGGLCSKHYAQHRCASDPEFRARQVKATSAWKKRNPEKDAKAQKEYGTRHSKRLYESRVKWREENWDYYKCYLAMSKKRVAKATPAWVDRQELIAFTQYCPKGFHIDHIIPIQHPDVCGLNVPWNLQCLSQAENLSKSNKFDGTYENETWLISYLKKYAA